jgi:hypothetical protein
MNFFCAKKRYKTRFVFSNNIAVLSLYIYDETNEIGLDSLLQYVPVFPHDHFSVHSLDDQ